MTPPAALELIGVSKTFGDFTALHPLDLRIPRGVVFGYLGPNGAGKTTTIRILTGLLRPSTGRAAVMGYDIDRDYLEARRCFTYIPDEGFLYPRMTALEFLSFVWVVHFGKPPALERIREVLGRVGLEDWADTLIEQFSHGMRQRLLFAAAVLRDTPVWIIDEPIIGLDPHAVRMVKDLMRRKARRGGTVFLSTHLLSLAEEICDEVAILHRGRLIARGSLDRVRGQGETGRPGDLEEVFVQMTRDAAADGLNR